MLRQKIIEEWKNLQIKLTQRQMVVYQPWTGPRTHSEKDCVKELSMKDFLALRTHGKVKEYENVVKKLDLIKSLVAENKLERLKWLCKRGEL